MTHLLGKTAQDYLRQLSECSESKMGVTRFPFTPEHRRANALLTAWMEEAGLRVHMDDAGTLIGRYDAGKNTRTLLMGSHQDSVKHGGAYDGIMGIVLPIIALQALKRRGIQLPYSVEVLAFGDEEGVRFPTALVGPRALAGTIDISVIDRKDKKGISLHSALTSFGLEPEKISQLQRSPENIIGFIETHIEQGPVLEHNGLPLGVVSAICGIERHQLTFTGQSAHAGTVPMHLRKDALTAAATVTLEAEKFAIKLPDLLATVGQLDVTPNVPNAVPGKVSMTIELRSSVDEVREKAGEMLQTFAKETAQLRGLGCEVHRTYSQSATRCDPDLQLAIASAIGSLGKRVFTLPSGATHDASAMADLTPVAMLFVRCKKGISHNPAEFASDEDMGLAVKALMKLLCDLQP
ncbi:M20 family metallo-hydrolase [Enterovibrio nigricans]|uniref:Allantoate deiminase n=1 Tax=Enterovibrio nigricans DSM 22720 TaxID=1121868 RepID=A0A1T4VTT2_9GAMM|nr:M20 family metallo-hydrolase [Enterovibrio nigricans]SKA68255.1 allantoate deiminase [Enterovibrio nigricans DSM 22720]